MRFLTKFIFLFVGLLLNPAFAKNCKSPIVVAVIDTGLDVTHPLIKKNLWTNRKDNSHGWDFTSNSTDVSDSHGHGTHVSGLIAQISSCVKLMTLKYYDAKVAKKSLDNSIKAIKYAVDNGAKIINYSGGGTEYSKEEYEALRYARRKGVFVVAAAGNEKTNIDSSVKYYPASYNLPNIISVAAVKSDDVLVPSSNWGSRNVDVATIGFKVLSAVPGDKMDAMTGTSQATALVTGYVVNLMKNRSYTYNDLKRHLIKKSRKTKSLFGKVKSGGVLDVISPNQTLSLREAK